MSTSLDATAAKVARLPRQLTEDAAKRFDDIALTAASRVVGTGARMDRARITLGTRTRLTGTADTASAAIEGTPRGPWVWIEDGTRPHRIAGRLMWGPGLDHPVRVVSHPGMRGQRAWTRAVETFRRDFTDLAGQAVSRTLDG